jgi:histidine ammonia-lyase
MYLHLYHVVPRQAQLFPTLSSSCEARCAPVVVGGGLQFGLVRRAVSVFAPRTTPNKLLLTAVRLLSQARVAAWPLAVATGELQHAIPHCLGSRAAFQASLGPISTRLK